jgi:hypothetical protein
MNKLLLLVCLSGTALYAHSQTDEEIKIIQSVTNLEQLKKLSDSFHTAYQQNRRLMLSYAAAHNWPSVLQRKQGGAAVLYGITPDLQPVYAETLNTGAGNYHPGR